jgi:exosome complex RNA-binding protein Rrp4
MVFLTLTSATNLKFSMLKLKDSTKTSQELSSGDKIEVNIENFKFVAEVKVRTIPGMLRSRGAGRARTGQFVLPRIWDSAVHTISRTLVSYIHALPP